MAQGAVYKDSWNDERYFGDEKLNEIYDTGWKYRRFISIDYGTVNPMVFLDIWDDGETAWIVKEYLLGQPGRRTL